MPKSAPKARNTTKVGDFGSNHRADNADNADKNANDNDNNTNNDNYKHKVLNRRSFCTNAPGSLHMIRQLRLEVNLE